MMMNCEGYYSYYSYLSFGFPGNPTNRTIAVLATVWPPYPLTVARRWPPAVKTPLRVATVATDSGQRTSPTVPA